MGKKGGGKFKAKKGPFDDLDDEYKAAIDGGTVDEVKDRIVKAALDSQSMIDAKEADFDLKAKQEAAADAAKVYTEAAKMNKLRIKYAHQALRMRGIRVNVSDLAKNAVKALKDSVPAGTTLTIRSPEGREATIEGTGEQG